jgi:hypothetical protein
MRKFATISGTLLFVASSNYVVAQQQTDFERSLPRIERGQFVNPAPAPADHSIPTGIERGGVRVEPRSGADTRDGRGNDRGGGIGVHIEKKF